MENVGNFFEFSLFSKIYCDLLMINHGGTDSINSKITTLF